MIAAPVTVGVTSASLAQMKAEYGEPVWQHRDAISRLYSWLTDDERITLNTVPNPHTVIRERRNDHD